MISDDNGSLPMSPESKAPALEGDSHRAALKQSRKENLTFRFLRLRRNMMLIPIRYGSF